MRSRRMMLCISLPIRRLVALGLVLYVSIIGLVAHHETEECDGSCVHFRDE